MNDKTRANKLYDAISNLPDELLDYKEGNEDMKEQLKNNDSNDENVVIFNMDKQRKSPLFKVLLVACAAAVILIVLTVTVINSNKHKNVSTAASGSPQVTDRIEASATPTNEAPKEVAKPEDSFSTIFGVENTTSIVDADKAYIAPLEYNKEHSIDLDCDGVAEKVLVKKTVDDVSNVTFVPSINSTVLDFNLGDKIDGCETTSNIFYIADIDNTDKYKEIAIVVQFGNDRTKVIFYRYVDNKLKSLGTIDGAVAFNSKAICGDSVIYGSHPSEFFTLWTLGKKYKLENDSFVQDSDLYYAISSDVNVTINKDLSVFSENSTTSEKSILKAGSKVQLISTDEKEWVNIKTNDGLTKSIHMLDSLNIDNAGKSVSSEELLTAQ